MVSVIIPAYNAGKNIERCLDSICSQSYEDLQIIVIDDGSQDDTYNIIKKISLGDSRIIPVHKDNGGVSSARNVALDMVAGEYVFFLDADDVVEKDAIRIMVDAMHETKSDWVSAQYSRWKENGDKLSDFDFTVGNSFFSSDNERIKFALNELLPYRVGYEVWSKLYKSDIIRDNGIIFPENCKRGEDLAFNLKYLMHAEKITCIALRAIRYIITENSAMGQLNTLSVRISENIKLLEDVYDYIELTNNTAFAKKFSLMCFKLMEQTYVGYTPNDVVKALKQSEDSSFFIERFDDFLCGKDEYLLTCNKDIRDIKLKYHMFIIWNFKGFPLFGRIMLTTYNFYRSLRHRPVLQKWKMPY
ncbi:glycosyltransferase family 2 protein [Butyrivibrio sp. INlla16]|uniref:glycosyltransferase family 2 protein n=1 Tax=Butyrivibrio sp. INlla16 TaxID=1520807 RepID=UPI00087ECB3E|nr:glycosyltransferase family 2 protein [Butyrivibrio sp. INlla16]SDB68546.1 Glycosyl transferase family 2 [Butyrivibrio sp. INlla16]